MMFGVLMGFLSSFFGVSPSEPSFSHITMSSSEDSSNNDHTFKDQSTITTPIPEQCQVVLTPRGECVVEFTVSCDSKIRLLTRGTPLEGMMGDIFDVKNSTGKSATYLGRQVKRGRPTRRDYKKVKAKKPLSISIDLSLHYELEPNEVYVVQFYGNQYSNQLPNSNVVQIPPEM